VAAVAEALRNFDTTADVSCRLEPPQHAEEWAPHIVVALWDVGYRVVEREAN
jgi:hypothetical protein